MPITRDTCLHCGQPIIQRADGGWIHRAPKDPCLIPGDALYEDLSRRSLAYCGPLFDFKDEPAMATPAGGVVSIRHEEPAPRLKELIDRYAVKVSILICNICYRPQPEVKAHIGRKCVCCGNTNEYRFSRISLPRGVSYIWAERRLETGCEVYV